MMMESHGHVRKHKHEQADRVIVPGSEPGEKKKREGKNDHFGGILLESTKGNSRFQFVGVSFFHWTDIRADR